MPIHTGGCLTVLGDRQARNVCAWGKPWDRQPISGKLRRKSVSVPGLRRIAARLPPKRLPGVFRERLVEKQQQIVGMVQARFNAQQEWLARRTARLASC